MGHFKKSSPIIVVRHIGVVLSDLFFYPLTSRSIFYKYLKLCSNFRVTTNIFLLMLCIPTFFSVFPVILIGFAISPNETELVESTFPVSSNDYTLSYFSKQTAPLMFFINLFLQNIIFLKRSSNSLSQKRYRELNIQITTALMTQVFVPFVLTLLPSIFYVFATEQKLDLKNFSFFMNLLINWSP
uniref:G protein-coupled receptor n=1 Tax=Ditylenchus dipsaci TaxID=166011 RepID=A0A915CRE3_9BILA